MNDRLQHHLEQHRRLGHRITPIPVGHKYPTGINQWQKKASSNIDRWAGTNHGIGWVLGRQENGRCYIAIDVDTHDNKPGPKRFVELVRQHGLEHAIQNTVTARTGGGGFHFIFETNEPYGNGIFTEDIGEYKGENGFIVVAPTIHPNTGVLYEWAPGKAPWDIDPQPLPEPFADIINAPAVVGGLVRREVAPGVPARRAITPTGEFDPAEWVRQNIGYRRLLEDLGWTDAGRGQWTRPGKTPREGTSATLHEPDGPLVVFSTTGQGMLGQVGTTSGAGSVSYSPLDLYAALHHSGDLSETAKALRQQHRPTPLTTITTSSGETREINTDDRWCNLPVDFWDTRPWLTHIRTAAHSRIVAADAVLAATLARISTLIPPSYKIPPIVGAPASFDVMSVIVGNSSAGKSAAMHVARELVPIDRKRIKTDRKVSTGEGLVEAFMGNITITDDDGKEVKERGQCFDAVHFTVDEGLALVAANRRDTSTIASELCSAWSGAPLGQENANAERRRFLAPGKGRVAGVVAIQTDHAHQLLEPGLISQGFSGRLQFYWGVDNLIDPDTEWDGHPLTIPTWPTFPKDTYLKVADTIRERIINHQLGRQRGELEVPAIDGHRNLVILKTAGIFALMDDRTTITDNDWELAETMVTASTRIRTLALEHHRIQQSREEEERARGQGRRDHLRAEAAAAAETDRLNKVVERVRAAILDAGTDGLIHAKLRDTLPGKDRHLLDDALDELGAVATPDGRTRRWTLP